MSVAQPARQVSETEPLPARPRLYQPADTLFNFRRQPGYYNAEAKAALLRHCKDGPHDELFVDFSTSEVHIELRAGGNNLFSGDWTWQAAASGQSLVSQGPWTDVCWHRNEACDYLEIEMPLTDGWRLERHMLLAREDKFLLLADALIGPNGPTVELHHRYGLPLSTGASFVPAAETREGYLEMGSGRGVAAIVPPALAEWRSEFCHADLSIDGRQLRLQQAGQGCNLFAPLWLDLDPRRVKRPVTWRRLTVAENLSIVSRDVAVAYRIQAGKQQWLIYRSLAPVGNRSVMGHNTCHSFVCSRILATGDPKAIVEIEQSDSMRTRE